MLTSYRIGDPGGTYPIFDETGSTIAPARHSFPCIPGVDHRGARVIEIFDIARDDDEIMRDRGGRDQPVGVTPRTQGGNLPPLDSDLVGNSKNAVGMIAPKLLQLFCERCRAPRIGFLLQGNAAHDFTQRDVAEMDTERINRPEPVHRLGCHASAMSRVWRGM